MSSELSSLPYISFLSAYPYPAFILVSRLSNSRSVPSLNPVFGNTPYRSLLLGPSAENTELGNAFVEALKTVEHSAEFSSWLARGSTSDKPLEESFAATLHPYRAGQGDPVVLELTQTLVENYIVVTSVPRTRIIQPSTQVDSSSLTTSRNGREFGMKLKDFPSNSMLSLAGQQSLTVNPCSRPLKSPDRSLEPQPRSFGTMREMIESYDWSTTPIGPRAGWSPSMNTIVNMILSNPYPQSVWIGQDLVLLYNDAYADMAGSKHPRIFAEKGSVSWSELWEFIGPLAERVLKGETIAKKDDLLFFNRLGPARLPEETYHCWSWVPISGPEGDVLGIINETFETTQKVVTERRLDALHDMSHQAGLAKSQKEFASSVLNVLGGTSLDAPFAAFYFASSRDEVIYPKGPRTSYIENLSSETGFFTVDLHLAGTVGIPTGHPSMINHHKISLDPCSIRSSPRTPPVNDLPNMPPADTSDNISEGGQPVDDQPYSYRDVSENGSRTIVNAPTHSAFQTRDSARGTSDSSAVWPFVEIFTSRRAVHVPSLPDYVVEGFEIRGWGEHAREAVVIPISTDDAFLPVGVLILGLNSRRPYDDDYSAWIDLMRVSLNALLTAVKGRETDAIRAEQLAQLDAAKTTFFSNASHELRTPLALIAGPLQDCIAQTSDAKMKETLKLATRNVSRLLRLVGSLMDFSKIAANKLEGCFRPVPLGVYTADLASMFRSTIEKDGIEFSVDCDSHDRHVCYIDPDFWEKIVFNLIGNAFKYTLQGSIHVSLKFDDELASFVVEDTGVGVPQQDIVKIFDRFHRVESISRSYEGTGIGLALVKELVKLHGGNVMVQSRTKLDSPDAHGSTFTITIPLGKDHLPRTHIQESALMMPQSTTYARGIVDEATQWSRRSPNEDWTPTSESDSGSGTDSSSRIDPSTLFFEKSDTILLVEDNADMRRYIKSIFIPYCKVVEATNGQEALEALDRLKPSIILSDVMLPVMDGFTFLAKVRDRTDTALVPIILVTAKEGEEARVEGLLSGADDYLGKPFNSRELIARVHLQLQLGKRRDALEAKFLERTHEIKILSDLSPVGIFRTNIEGRIVYVNPRWWEISGLDKSSSPDDWFQSIIDTDIAAVSQAWYDSIAQHSGASIDFRFTNGNYAKGEIEPVITENGTFKGIIGTITDVSEQRLYEAARLAHAQERLEIARRQAEEAEERRRESDERRRGQELLIDVTSHELRQPVSAILNCSSLVRSNLVVLQQELWRSYSLSNAFYPSKSLMEVIDEDLEALDSIYQCGLAQARIANDVLSLSRIQLQVLSIHQVEFDLVTEVKRILSIFKNELKMKKIKLDVVFGQNIATLGATHVKTDTARFGQVITNLLSNGIKFADTSTGKREIVVTVDVCRHAPDLDGPCVPPVVEVEPVTSHEPIPIFLFVSVNDSGPGLKPDDLALLFKRFQQGSNSHNVFGGSGLGLFVSRKLCELLGGRIDVDCRSGQGATFRFFVAATTALIAPVDGSTRGGTNHVQPSSPRNREPEVTRQLRVLITEDNLINQTVLNRQLKKAGYLTVLASNGLQAIEEIKKCFSQTNEEAPNAFDAVLMDCEMPVMDGLTAVREIRRLENEGSLPKRHRIFALTGNARGAQIENARDAGMDDVLIKPYKLDELLERIKLL